MKTFLLSTFLLIICFKKKAQILDFYNGKSDMVTLKTAFTQLYHYNFENPEKTIRYLEVKYADHPVIKILTCLVIYRKNFPISAHPKEYEQYKKELLMTPDKNAKDCYDEAADYCEYVFVKGTSVINKKAL